MLDHLKHMANVRPEGLDKSAAVWALAEIERLQLALAEERVKHSLTLAHYGAIELPRERITQ